MAVIYSRGRLPLTDSPERSTPAQRELNHIRPLAVEEEETFHLTRLPHIHNDPFDRLLASQAILKGMILVSPDPFLARYPVRIMW